MISPNKTHTVIDLVPVPLPAPFSPAVYIIISYRLFHVTNDLKLAIVPHDDNRMLLRNALVAAAAGGAVLASAFVLTQARDLLAVT